MIIAITGVHAGCQRSPGLAVARALSASPVWDLMAIDYDDFSTGLNSPTFSDRKILLWSDHPSKLIVQIEALKKCNDIKLLFPCLNVDVEVFSKISTELQRLGIQTLLPSCESIRNRSKVFLESLSKQIGIDYPKSVVCYSHNDLSNALSKIEFPCVLKGKECGVFPVRDKALFSYYATSCTGIFGFPIIVQKWMEGEEFSILGLFGIDRRLYSHISVKKIGIGDDGESWMSVVVDSAELLEWLNKIAIKLDWVGPIECDFLRNDEGMFLLDVNPRFPDWVDGPAIIGHNLPLAAAHLALNLDIPAMVKTPAGTIFYKDFYDISLPISSFSF